MLFPLSLSILSAMASDAGAVDRDNWHMEYRPSQHIAFTSFLNWSSPDGNVGEYAVYAPIAPQLIEQQQVHSSFAINGHFFPAEQVAEASSYHRSVFFARIPSGNGVDHTNLTVSVIYEANLIARFLKPGPGTNPPPVLTARERAASLSDSPGFGYKSSVFTAWLKENDLFRKQDETAITFGRRACEFVQDHMTPTPPVPTWHEPLDEACHRLQGGCGAYSRLYVGILRANGIPARCLVGYFVPLNKTEKGAYRDDSNVDTHVRTEFFAEGVGWVPVDTTRQASIAMGVDYGNFITLHIYAEEPISLPLRSGGVREQVAMMSPFISPLANPVGHPKLDGWYVVSPIQTTSTPITNPTPSEAKPGTANRLKELKDLFDQGLISNEIYDQKRQQILDSL